MPSSVLVVDDDIAFRALAGRVMSSCGYRVVGEAGSIAEALVQARQLRPDIALVDVGLPDGSGMVLSEALTAMPWPLRVVLVSADPDQGGADAVDRSGARGFLPKDELESATLLRLLGDA